MKKISHVLLVLTLGVLFAYSCSPKKQSSSNSETPKTEIQARGTVLETTSLELDFSAYKVTFLEIGAKACIPCRQMQPIMREIAKEFPNEVHVVFYDVWKDPNPARKYGIQLIPTQVFIDQKGKEIFRHVGFFPKEEIVKLLRENGVK
jgi:thioredoxin 1